MAERQVRLTVRVEHLETEYGSWCLDCNLGSGARVWVVVTTGDAMVLQSRVICVDCDGRNVAG